jgi:hypothetical protein
MEKEYIVKILKTGFLTHNVKSFIIEKPNSYNFISGQATDISINNSDLKDEKRPFTFTSTPKDMVLEFIIKKYPKGITEKIHELEANDELIIGETFGYFDYKGEGIFIAGGTGITPFLSIFRNIGEETAKNKLIFSNKTHKDIICERELKEMFKENLILLLTNEKKEGYLNARINKDFLKENITDFTKHFYVCGPIEFVKNIKLGLIELGASFDKIVVEK